MAPDVAVIDGVTEAMSLEGLHLGENHDIAVWIKSLPRRLGDAGAAVLALDHVTKSREGRDRWAIGGQHKLAGVDGASFTVEAVAPLARARHEPIEGKVRLSIAKDRRGHLRTHAEGGAIADVTVTSYPDGGISVNLEAPGRGALDDHQRRVVEHLAVYPDSSKSSLRDLGNSDTIDDATKALVAAGDIEVEKKGNAHLHRLTFDAYERWAEVIDKATGSPAEDPET